MRKLLRRLPAPKKPGDRGRKGYGFGERDKLTGLADKNAFQRIVEESLADGQEQGCLVLVDVDRMQEINDQCGRETGDRVLQIVAAVLRDHFRAEKDTVGRLGEDVFALWIGGLSAEQVGGIRRRIATVNDRLLHAEEGLPAVTLSAGAALGEPGGNYQELYIQAEKVLHRVKEGGRCGCEINMNSRKVQIGG